MAGHRSFDELRNRMFQPRRERNDAAISVLLHEQAEEQRTVSLSDRDSQGFARALTMPDPGE